MNYKAIYQAIHKQLHSRDGKGLRIGDERCPVLIGKNRCRYMKYDNKIFIQQDPRRPGFLSQKVKDGEQITRIIRSGKPWGWMNNKEIHDPLEGK